MHRVTRLLRAIAVLGLVAAATGCTNPVAVRRVERAAVGSVPGIPALEAARNAWQALVVAPDDAESRDAYREAIARLLADATPNGISSLRPQLVFDRGSHSWPPASFTKLERSDRFEVRGLSQRFLRDGIGLPVVGSGPAFEEPPGRRARRPPEGRFEPATALLAFPRDDCAVFTLVDPRRVATLRLQGATRPVAGDYTAHYAMLLASADLVASGRRGLLDPGPEAREGLYLLEPYDANKTPVVLVHGLGSSPLAWRELTHRIFGLPDLRNRYQVWHYFYPTGIPYLYAGRGFRAALTATLRELDPTGAHWASTDVILVGHSMGGLLSRTAVSHSGDAVWRSVFSVSPEALVATDSDRRNVREIFFFDPLPFVGRAAFVMTPHRGSDLAARWYAGLGSGLVRLPTDFTALFRRIVDQNPNGVRPAMRKMLAAGGPTSIRALRPDHPVLEILSEVPIGPGVPFHSVIGELGDGRGDDVVSFESAYLAGAASTEIVAAGHRDLEHPAVNEALVRILRTHMADRPRPRLTRAESWDPTDACPVQSGAADIPPATLRASRLRPHGTPELAYASRSRGRQIPRPRDS